MLMLCYVEPHLKLINKKNSVMMAVIKKKITTENPQQYLFLFCSLSLYK